MKKRNPLLDPILQRNEIDANKTISLASFVTAFVMIIIWVFYIIGLFAADSMVAVNIIFPIVTLVLVAPLFLRKTKFVEYRGYKYFLLSLLFLMIFLMNVIVPTYTMLTWLIPLPVASHYYTKRTTFIVFLITLALMAIALPLGAAFGEFDSELFKVSANEFKNLTRLDTGSFLNPDSISDRFYFLGHPEEYTSVGINISRWAFAFVYMYLVRALAITVVFVFCFLLDGRTSRLFESESKAVRDNQKMKSELDVASSIQRSVLPLGDPSNDHFRIHAIMDPSKEVGGDFYDYYFIDKDRFLIAVGDVSGKSIPGAMFMMKAETLIKTVAPIYKESNKILSEVNNILNESNTTNMYVTVWLGIYDTKNRTLSFTNAGHNSPIYIHDGKVTFLKDRHNMALGILKNKPYDIGKIKMCKGDKILLYTDGVTEAHNEANELYGENRLVRLIKSDVANSPRAIISSISDDLVKFAGNRQQFDDITMLMLEATK